MTTFKASDGAEIHYTDEGSGLPVLCLSGLSRTGQDFDYLAPHLPDVRLIRPDYRGRGKSAWTGEKTYTVPRESRDAVELLDHLGIDRAALIGTSRGGLNGLFLAATQKARLRGLCLVDVGPEIAKPGLDAIFAYIGRNPRWKTYAEAAEAMPSVMTGFANVPAHRWEEEVRHHYIETPSGLEINYDPALRDAFLAAFQGPPPDLWPLFDALADLPVALIRAANSDLLTPKMAEDMQARRPDILFGEVPDRAHVPFLDEPVSLAVVRAFLKACQ